MPKKAPPQPAQFPLLTQTLEVVPLDTLRPHPRNYRTHPATQLTHLRASLQQHGVYRNVVMARDGTLLAGHGVVEAARSLGLTTLPVQRLDLDPEDPRALQILVGDNALARLALDDEAALRGLLEELHAQDAGLLAGTGYDEALLAALTAEHGAGIGTGGIGAGQEVTEPDIPPDRLDTLMQRWNVQPGDLWALGDHRVVCADCLVPATLPRLVAGETPAMVWADPPYGVSIVATNEAVGSGEAYHIPFGGVKHKSRGQVGHHLSKPFGHGKRAGGADPVIQVGKYAPVLGDDSTQTASTAATTLLAAFPDAVHVWWGGNYYTEVLPPSSCWLVWNKETTGNFADCELAWTNQPKAARLFTHRWNGMLRASEHERRWHPTQKPAALAAWAYETFGQPGDLILDPFLGAGCSLLAAEQRQRRVVGCECSVEYVAITLERWAILTGLTPTRLEG